MGQIESGSAGAEQEAGVRGMTTTAYSRRMTGPLLRRRLAAGAANATEKRTMTDASIVAKPAYDQVLTLSLERCLVDGMAPPLVVCLVGVTGAAHVVRYRPPDLLGEHVGGELVARAMEPEGDTVAAAIYVKVSLLS